MLAASEDHHTMVVVASRVAKARAQHDVRAVHTDLRPRVGASPLVAGVWFVRENVEVGEYLSVGVLPLFDARPLVRHPATDQDTVHDESTTKEGVRSVGVSR